MKQALAVFTFLVLAAGTRADSVTDFAFAFADTGTMVGPNGNQPSPPILGVGSFEAVPDVGFPGGYAIESLTGEMNGQPMDLVYGNLGADLHFGEFVQNQLDFTVDGVLYAIFEADTGPFPGPTLWVGGLNDATEEIPLALTVADPAPADTPEPSSLLLMAFGLALVGVAFAWRRTGARFSGKVQNAAERFLQT
jgi:hypothetical protein